MTLTRRRRLIFTIVRCVLLTLIALALDWAGYLVKLEHGLYDFRSVHCQRHRPKPTDLLVHLDIDDNALEQIGRFPWSRALMAEILDEIRLTEPKLLLMDILFSEAQSPYYDMDKQFHDPDSAFAESIKKLGVALVPCSFSFNPLDPPGSLKERLVAVLQRNPELPLEQCVEQLPHAGKDQAPSLDDVRQAILSARPEALYRRIYQELESGDKDRAALKRQLLPHLDPTLTGSVLGGLFDQEYETVIRERALTRFTLKIPPQSPPILHASDEITPIRMFSDAARFSGFVDYLPDHTEGTVRQVPLVASYNGRLVPHMSLVAACAALNVDVHTLRLATDSLTIPRPGGKDIVIPVSTRSGTDVGSVGFLMELPMYGKKGGWLSMYDYPKLKSAAQHVSVYEVYRIYEQRQRLARNEASARQVLADIDSVKQELDKVEKPIVDAADDVITESLKLIDPEAGVKYHAAPLTGQDQMKLVRTTLDNMAETIGGLSADPSSLDADSKKFLENLRKQYPQLKVVLRHAESTTRPTIQEAMSDERQRIGEAITETPELKERLAAMREIAPESKNHANLLISSLTTNESGLRGLLKQNDMSHSLINSLRRELRSKLHGRAIFVGGTATTLSDLRPTSLNYACPGIVIHGAIFNAILTEKLWRVVPRWWLVLITVFVGLLTGVIVSALAPLRAFLAACSLIAGYLLFNGFYLFDAHNLIVGAAGPLMAGVLVWSGITLTDFIIEIAERNRITKRFRNYVDPTLVDWVLNHPEQTRFDGEVRVMTMAFSDLAGFTAMTEHLGERAIPLLARYMGKMVPVIRAHKGYVSKLMGDGIYFFFGAPEPSSEHAVNAVSAVLGMHNALTLFNEDLKKEGLPLLGMRLGVSTGRVVIGDAGPEDASDYTAMGDVVNLASRLETANKVFGTKTLITNKTVELLGDAYLVRPIANLRVAGKTEGVPVFEPLSFTESASPEQKKLAELTAQVVGAYQRGAFVECIAAADKMDREIGPGKLTILYHKLCKRDLAEPPENFDGQVVLTEK